MAYCTACGREIGEAPDTICECGASPPPLPQVPSPAGFEPGHSLQAGFAGDAIGPRHFARFLGDGWTLFRLHLVNILFTFLTIGIYFFWAKAKVRRYFYGQTEFEGARFGYHGTGKELLMGWLRAAVFFAAYILFSWIAEGALGHRWGPIVSALVLYVALILLIPAVLISAWRFALSRTSYRGIRFSYSTDRRAFTRFYIKGALLSLVTLFFYTPIFMNDLRRWYCRGVRYGNRQFDYDGEGRPLFWPYVANILLLIPTLGIWSFWFRATLTRHFWNHTTFGPARFRCTVTGGGLLALGVTNLLLVLFTLGLGLSWARVRSARYILSNLSLNGPLDFDSIAQEIRSASATGEQLADMLDIGDTGFDVGI